MYRDRLDSIGYDCVTDEERLRFAAECFEKFAEIIEQDRGRQAIYDVVSIYMIGKIDGDAR